MFVEIASKNHLNGLFSELGGVRFELHGNHLLGLPILPAAAVKTVKIVSARWEQYAAMA